MKPFLGIDLTTNKKNEEMNGEELIVSKPSLALTQSLERSSGNVEETIEKSKLPLPIRIGRWICGAFVIFVVYGIVKSLADEDGVTLGQAYQNAPWLFWLGGGCLFVWLLLTIIGARKETKVLDADESSQVFDDFGKTCDAIFSELDVPENAKEIDVLYFYYKVKGDDIKVCEKGLQVAPYINPVFRVFADSVNLYFANLEEKYAIPLSSIKSITSVKKTISILEWNKDEPYNKGIYKQYKLSENNYGSIICKNYHILNFEHDNELWGIYIPCYELPVIEELTGLKAEAF